MDFWLSHVVRPSFLGYAPDIARLRAGPARIVVVVGDRSAPHQMAYQTTNALADQLGTAPVTVGGDHNAVTTVAEAFAATLEELLAAPSRPDGGGRRWPRRTATSLASWNDGPARRRSSTSWSG